MENDSVVSRELSLAVHALATLHARDVSSLGLLERVILLCALPDVAQLSRSRELVATGLAKQLSRDRITQNSLGEVFGLLAALWSYDSTLVPGERLAEAIQLLVKSEVLVGGPYASPEGLSLQDNVFVALFMKMASRPLPGLDAYLTQEVRSRRITNVHYLERSIIMYLLGQAQNNPELRLHVASLWQCPGWASPQRTAIALSVLGKGANLVERERAIARLAKPQERSGFWAGEKVAANAAASKFITTAIIAGVLHGFSKGVPHILGPALQKQHLSVGEAARQRFASLSEPLRSYALAVVRQVYAPEKNYEITLLPRMFASSLKVPSRITDSQYTMLGLANVCGWLAYTIYDDFLDEEGAPTQLPIANIAMRVSLECFDQVLPRKEFHKYVAEVFSAMDEANFWELRNCRFKVSTGSVTITRLPDYGKAELLAARSFAHALGPLAVLGFYPSTIEQKQNIERAFRHYLIARQLSDDLRDWLDDIKLGQVSFVVAAILRDMRIMPGNYQLAVLLPAMRSTFRRHTLADVCRQALGHIQLSRNSFEDSELLSPASGMYSLLNNLERTVKQSLSVQSQAQALAKSLSH